MHEYSVLRSILMQVEEFAGPKGLTAVREIRVSVGEFSGIDPELLQLAFEQVSAESGRTQCRLVVQPTLLSAECAACGTEFAPTGFVFRCPHCGSGETEILRGEELVLESLTLQE